MDPALYELCTDTVYIQSYTGQDAHGNNTYGNSLPVRSRVDLRSVQRGSSPGHDQLSPLPQVEYTIYMDVLASDPSVRDKLVVAGEEVVVTNVAVYTDERGPSHYVVTASKAVEL